MSDEGDVRHLTHPASRILRPVTAMRRDEALARLDEPYDLLVIGGGASGLGVALDSAARGYRTLLVEARDFAQGTSSRSTKLVHGGVRYLEQGNLRLVREALRERGRLLRNAPHLVRELRFLAPAYAWWQTPFYGSGLLLYDLLAGRTGLPRARVVSAATAARLVPTIARDGLRGGVTYSDAQFNDARLAIVLASTAASHGATLLNYMAVVELSRAGGRLEGATVEDVETGRRYAIRARAVVNATGVFGDTIRRLDDPGAPALIAASRGIHLVLERDFLPGETAVLVPRSDDGRVVFIIPWQRRTLLGTTDTPIDEPAIEPAASAEEVDFVLQHAARYLTRAPTRADVLSTFAGLRPLVRPPGARRIAATARLGRDHTILTSRSGLVTVAGGKWTTYRQMAAEAVDRAAAVAGLPPRHCVTADLRLAGADATDLRWREFGARDEEIAACEAAYPGELHSRLPYSLAMAAWVIEREMPVRLEDVLSRRLRALVLDARAAVEAAPRAAALMAQLQGRDDAWARAEVDAFRRLADAHYTVLSADSIGQKG